VKSNDDEKTVKGVLSSLGARPGLLLGQRQNSRLLGVSGDPARLGLLAAALHATNCGQARPVELGDD